jgi:hypothetical protein
MSLMQGSQGQTGKAVGQNLTAGFGEFSDVMVTELMPRYYQNTYRGQKFFVGLASAAPTAFVGAAGGTPLLSIYNPIGSGKNLVLVSLSLANRVTPTGAGTTSFCLWGGQTAPVTGTLVNPTNMLNQQAVGSVAKSVNNTATTGSTALAVIKALGFQYWATAAGAFGTGILHYDSAGEVIIAPGCMLAFGATVVLTSATYDCSMIWDEIPV